MYLLTTITSVHCMSLRQGLRQLQFLFHTDAHVCIIIIVYNMNYNYQSRLILLYVTRV